jgi:cell division control protein 11
VTVGEFDVFRKNLPLSHPFVELEEDGLRISLTVVDTPGFGDNIDNRNASVKSVSRVCHGLTFFRRFQEIVDYLERQYDDILAERSRIKRNPRFVDKRVHAALYFIPPGGHA